MGRPRIFARWSRVCKHIVLIEIGILMNSIEPPQPQPGKDAPRRSNKASKVGMYKFLFFVVVLLIVGIFRMFGIDWKTPGPP